MMLQHCLRVLAIMEAVSLVSAGTRARKLHMWRTTASCDCLGDAALLQNSGAKVKKSGVDEQLPDCTCIDGTKTYPTTPRDELLGMGKVAIGHHLHSCLRRRDELEQQSEYADAASKAQMDEVKGQLSTVRLSVEGLRNTTSKNRADLKETKAKLMEEVKELQLKVVAARDNYTAQFSEWHRVKTALSEKLTVLNSCECARKAEVVLLSQAKVHGAFPDRDMDYMYDTAHKIEDCENSVVRLANKMELGQARTRGEVVKAVQEIASLKRSASEQQRLGTLLSVKPQIKGLEKTKAALRDTVSSWRDKFLSYETAAVSLKRNLAQLNSKLADCGCSS